MKMTRLASIFVGSKPKIKANTPSAAPPASVVIGAVDEFTKDCISGTLKSVEPSQVVLELNGRKVAATWSGADPGSTVQQFRFNLKDLWRYVRPTDKLTVRTDHGELSLSRVKALKGRSHSLSPDDLFKLLSEGRVFNQKGRLQLSKTIDLQWQDNIFQHYNALQKHLRSAGIDLIVCYGTCLGAVRAKNFIGHDHDFDTAYISRHFDPVSVRKEIVEIGILLGKLGYKVEPRPTCLWVTDKATGAKIDIFHLYFDHDGKLQFPFGTSGVRAFTKADFDGYEQLTLADRPVLAVKNAQLLVEYIYGPNWQTPNPGFNWNRDRREADLSARLSKAERDLVHWTTYYNQNSILPPSRFFQYVNSLPECGDVIIDIGCGHGRDSFAFAAAGRHVYGIDSSHLAIEKAKGAAGEKAPRFSVTDFTSPEFIAFVSSVRESHRGAKITFYARFVLHTLSEEDQASLLGNIIEAIEPDEIVAFEFRTIGDEKTKKRNSYRDRRYIDTQTLSQTLATANGFSPIAVQIGTGFSDFGTENAVLGRVIVKKQRADETRLPAA